MRQRGGTYIALFVSLIVVGSLSLLYGQEQVVQRMFGDLYWACDGLGGPEKWAVNGEVWPFPIGLSCTWEGNDGGTYTELVEVWWLETVTTYLGLLAVAIGVIGLIRRRRRLVVH